MRLVVADAGPLHYLVLIGHVDLLPCLFDHIYLPSTVRDELAHHRAPPLVRTWISNIPAWLSVLPDPTLAHDPTLSRLDDGEAAAIVLAQSIGADLILMDDRAGVKAAREQGFAVTGTLGVLDMAARRGMIDIRETLERLRLTNFRFRPKLLDSLIGNPQD